MKNLKSELELSLFEFSLNAFTQYLAKIIRVGNETDWRNSTKPNRKKL